MDTEPLSDRLNPDKRPIHDVVSVGGVVDPKNWAVDYATDEPGGGDDGR